MNQVFANDESFGWVGPSEYVLLMSNTRPAAPVAGASAIWHRYDAEGCTTTEVLATARLDVWNDPRHSSFVRCSTAASSPWLFTATAWLVRYLLTARPLICWKDNKSQVRFFCCRMKITIESNYNGYKLTMCDDVHAAVRWVSAPTRNSVTTHIGA